MFITTFIIFPLISNQYQLTVDKTLQLPLYQNNQIDIIDEEGYIYKYYFSNDYNNLTQSTNCQAIPQYLDIEIEQQMIITHKTEQNFQNNFVDGKFYSQLEFIQSAVINHYGIIILTSDKNLTFISHKNIDRKFVLTQHYQIYESIENSHLIYIEKLNLLILLLQSNIVYEYEIRNNTYNNIQFINNYKQETIKTDQIQQIKVYSKYIFILFLGGSLIIFNRRMEWIHRFQSNIVNFEFEIISEQFRLYLQYQNGTLMYKNIEFNDKTIVIDDKSQMLLSKPKAVSFKLYKQGILVLVEGNNEEYTIIDYSYDNENLHEINIQVISHKIKQIIIHDYFALLIGEKMKSVITIGIDSVYLNQQNYKFQNNLLVPQILNVLVFSDIAKNEIKDYVYVYTRSKLLKLNLQARQFEIICSCQSKEQAKESPYYYELEYYNSKCDGCQKKRRYKLYFKYVIITKEYESMIIESIIIVVLMVIGIIGLMIHKCLGYISRSKQILEIIMQLEKVNAQKIQLETLNNESNQDFSINYSSITFKLE